MHSVYWRHVYVCTGIVCSLFIAVMYMCVLALRVACLLPLRIYVCVLALRVACLLPSRMCVLALRVACLLPSRICVYWHYV